MHSVLGIPGTVGSEERASVVLVSILLLGGWLIEVFTVFLQYSLSSHVGVFGRVVPLRSKNLHLSAGWNK